MQNSNIETAIMPFKVLQILEIIMEKKQIGYDDAFGYLYSSNLYQLLIKEDTKLWYISGLGLFELLEEEKESKKTVQSKILLFFAFCLEKYRIYSNKTAEETLILFKKFNVFEFLNQTYEILHTQGEDYIVEEIDLLIKERQK